LRAFDDPASPQRRPLPVLATAAGAYRTVLGDADRLLRIAGVWWLLIMGLQALGEIAIGPPVDAAAAGAIAASPGFWVLWLMGTAVILVAGFAVPVAWHRWLLLHDEAGWAAPVSVRVVAYALWGMLISVLAFVPIAIVMAALGFGMGSPGGAPPPDGARALAVAVASLAGFTLGLYLTARLSLVLPARAIGERTLGLVQAWRVAQAHAWRLVLVTLLTLLPTALVVGALGGLIGLVTWLPGIVSTAIGTAGLLLNASFLAAALSLAYRHIVGEPALTPAHGSP